MARSEPLGPEVEIRENVGLPAWLDDCYLEDYLTFTCGCGEQLTLADRMADQWTLGKSYR